MITIPRKQEFCPIKTKCKRQEAPALPTQQRVPDISRKIEKVSDPAMTNYILSCCSTADLSEQHFQERDIHYICFHYMLNGKSYSDDLGKTMSFDAFYQAMADGAETRTSQVNVDEYIAYFTSFLEQGLDILHVLSLIHI